MKYTKILFTLLFLNMIISACNQAIQTVPSSTTTPTRTPYPTHTLTPIPSIALIPLPLTTTPIPTRPSVTIQSSKSVSEVVNLVEELAVQDQFSGAVLVASGNEVVWEFANGLADREANIANQVNTKFNLGSMNKMFTAVAIFQLMEQNKLSLDDTIATHIPEYPNTEVANQVTIHQLLTHTSGLGDVFTDVFEVDPHKYRSNEDFLPLFVNEPLQFTPGDEFLYSNAGYVVLGLMIEAISGQSYYDYVQLNIFEPSGMVNTDSYNIEDEIPNLAIGYTIYDSKGNETGVLASNVALMPGKGFAAGGGYSTVEDLFLFRNALLGYQLLSPTSTNLLITGQVEVRENVKYAYGFFDKLEVGYRVVGHTGGAPGVCSFLSMYLDTGYTVVVLSNSDRDCLAVLTFLMNNPLQ